MRRAARHTPRPRRCANHSIGRSLLCCVLTPGQGIVLGRNPNYHGSRPQSIAQIQLAVRITVGRSVAQVEAGAVDYTTLEGASASGPAASGGLQALAYQLAARYGPDSPAAAKGRQQYFANPELAVDFFVLNTHRPLFSDTRMRQAVNYAIDRRALAQAGNPDLPLPEHPTDHYLPPGMPGYRDAHIYPLAPDPAKASQLAQGNGTTAVLYTCEQTTCEQAAQIVKTNLAAIGITLEVKTFPSSTLLAKVATPGEPFDLAYTYGWEPDYLDPSAMLTEMTENNSVAPPFEDPTYRHQLAAQPSSPGRNATWPSANSTSTYPATAHHWSPTATSTAATSSPPAWVAKHSDPTA